MKKGWMRFLTGLFSACFLSMLWLPVVVRADVLIEVADSFWEKHYGECDYLFRQYTVNGPEGYATLWESPVSSQQKENIVNGTEIQSNWHYTDQNGETWCVVQIGEWDKGYEKTRGWIKTSECLVIPDYISFEEEHGQEFVGYDTAYDGAFKDVSTVVLWNYPCSGRVAAEQIDAKWFTDNVTPSEAFDTCWRDSEGRLWAFVGYCYGIRNTWICLDDLTGTDIGAENIAAKDGEPGIKDVKAPVIYPPAEKLPSVRNGVAGIAIGGVAAVVAVTAGLMWFFFIRKKK